MNQEIKAKWVAALRSGEYKQTREVLKSSAGYCCLGVLCDISMRETGFGLADNRAENHDRQSLGQTIRDWAGLPYSVGDRVTIAGLGRVLSMHNDDGKTFLQIADAIEEQL